MERKGFVFYVSYLEAGNTLKPRERDVFYRAIIEYGILGEEPQLKGAALACWLLVKPNLDANNRKYQQGKKGGRPSKMSVESKTTGFSSPKPEEEVEKEVEVEEDGGCIKQDKDDSCVCASKTASTVFSTFAGADELLRKALSDYDLMRSEQGKPLTDTQRRSLCQQLDSEFQPCEWVQIIDQSTRRGWLQFFPLDKCQTVPKLDETVNEQLNRVLKSLNGEGSFL